MTGKIKFANFWGASLLAIMFGQPVTAGTLTSLNIDTTSEVIPATPFTITVTPPNTGTFVKDICVLDALTGKPMTPVAASPATGQYSVTAGAYLFAAADTGKKVYINYEYTSSLATAETMVAASLPMGATPFFSLSHNVVYQGQSMTWLFPRVTLSKGTLNLKNEGFLIPELDIDVIWDEVSNSPFTVSLSQ